MSRGPADTAISEVFAWEALDSRGNPTVGCEVRLGGGASGTATVPSGASTGAHEAMELRDGDDRYQGRGVRLAVSNVVGPLAVAVRGLDALDQGSVDDALREADGTGDLSQYGANAVLAVSVANALAAAEALGLPLYRSEAESDADELLPLPMVNVLSGGLHSGWAFDIQDVLVVPVGADSFAQAIEWSSRVRQATAAVLDQEGLGSALVADEGGLGPALPTNRRAVEILARGMERSGLEPGEQVAIAIDIAATQLFDTATGLYHLRCEKRSLSAADWLAEVASWVADFPVVSLEDVMAEDDWDGWSLAMAELAWIQMLGDDLFVTDRDPLMLGIESGLANAVLVKPNQTGTLSDARGVVDEAQSAGFATVLSARSGETEDSWLADLAVAWRTGQIKVGSTTRSDRNAKWNRLLRIEAQSSAATFAGRSALAPLPQL